MSTSSALEIQEFHQIDALDIYRDAWSRLLAQTPGANYFQTLDWLQVYDRYFGASREWRVLLVTDDDCIIGFLPLVIRKDRTPIGSLRTLTYPLDDWGTFYGPVGRRPSEILLAGLRHVRQSRRDWDVLDLHWIARGELDTARTRPSMQAVGFAPHERLCNQVAIVDLLGSWRHYRSSRKGKWRENQRRAERKAAAAGRVEFVHYRPRGERFGDDDPRWDLYATCEQLASRSWQGSASRGTTLSHGAVRPFLREVHAAAIREGSAEMHIIKIDDRPTAYLYNYVYEGNVYGLRSGYDPAFGELEVAKLLLAKAIETCFELEDRTFDLGPDQIEYKRHWATRIIGSYSYCYYPATDYRAQAVRWQRQMRAWLKPPDPLRSKS